MCVRVLCDADDDDTAERAKALLKGTRGEKSFRQAVKLERSRLCISDKSDRTGRVFIWFYLSSSVIEFTDFH